MIGLKGRNKRYALIAVCVLISLFFVCAPVFGSGGGGHGGADDGELMWNLLYRGINFALLVIILFIVIKKTSIKDFFSDRREEIAKNFTDLKADKDAAESRYKELERKLKEFEAKKNEIIAQFKADGLAEKEKIIAEARERAEQILAQADLTIGREIQGAKDRLKQQVVDSASQKALEIITKEIKSSDQDQLVNEFIESVEKLH
ncbi:MAG: ATP synthase F0 subunit B [Desulfobacterales bacterium]|nr:ATP synthase F0 subunit B [Desulfobacterales bacterium]